MIKVFGDVMVRKTLLYFALKAAPAGQRIIASRMTIA